MQRTTRTSAWLALVLGLAALTGCERPDDGRTAGQKVDEAVAQADRATDRAGQETRQAANRAGEAVGDAAITTKINMALAADDRLSALKIDVDTEQGRVALKGVAPDAASRERAAQIAQSVDGVTAVDNRLTVEAR